MEHAMHTHEAYMGRCLQLAALGAGAVAPNPLVGAVLVHEGRIIGEGWHQRYGGPHAEVHCLDSVAEQDRALIPSSTLYVSLEPCAHYGKTPPCSLRIIQERIPEVVVGVRDPFPAVDGRGIEQMVAAGVRVRVGVCASACLWQNRRFFTRQTLGRPYVILKWAETVDGNIAGPGGQPIAISQALVNRYVHRWRSEESAILVGRHTVETDDPQLNNRWWTGSSPVRIVADRQLSLSRDKRVFAPDRPVYIWNSRKTGIEGHLHYIQGSGDDPGPLLAQMAEEGIDSVLVEGGVEILKSFMRYGYVDEVRRIISTTVWAPGGKAAPPLHLPEDKSFHLREMHIGMDRVEWYESARTY